MPDNPRDVIVTLGDARLAQPSAVVDADAVAGEAFQARLTALRQAMRAIGANGIAAPQIGDFARFFMMHTQHRNARRPGRNAFYCWVNPEIVEASTEQCWSWEGCLSVPGYRGWVRRPAAIAVRGLNERGEPVSAEFTGWAARVFQHEFDHLDGMVFPYRLADPRHMVSQASFDRRGEWPADWPAPGARDTLLGETFAD